MYSNPPRHGAAIVTAILSDPELYSQWKVSTSGFNIVSACAPSSSPQCFHTKIKLPKEVLKNVCFCRHAVAR